MNFWMIAGFFRIVNFSLACTISQNPSVHNIFSFMLFPAAFSREQQHKTKIYMNYAFSVMFVLLFMILLYLLLCFNAMYV